MKRKVLVSMLCASMIGSMMTGMTVSADEPVTLDLYLDFTWFPTDSWTGIIPETLTENGGDVYKGQACMCLMKLLMPGESQSGQVITASTLKASGKKI